MTVWLPGLLVNPTNGSRGHWSKHSRWAKSWRDRTCMQILAVVGASRRHGIYPKAPKLVTFTAHVGAEWDDDGLSSALKPCRDALQDMRIIDNDRPSAGHQFIYEQVYPTPRQSRGVRIDVTEKGITP